MIEKINIAFCFDENMYMLAGVAIASLLYHAMNNCAYDIYCIVPEAFAKSKRDELVAMVESKDKNSKIIFLNANRDFDNSVVKQYTPGIFYRFMLLKLLPKNIDKIIYCDVDVTFHDNLIDLYNIDMKDNLIAGVADADQLCRAYPNNGSYINSGILLMNVSKLRLINAYDEWLKLSKQDIFAYPDQDILNKTCEVRQITAQRFWINIQKMIIVLLLYIKKMQVFHPRVMMV